MHSIKKPSSATKLKRGLQTNQPKNSYRPLLDAEPLGLLLIPLFVVREEEVEFLFEREPLVLPLLAYDLLSTVFPFFLVLTGLPLLTLIPVFLFLSSALLLEEPSMLFFLLA